jgi:poly(A) polymerase
MSRMASQRSGLVLSDAGAVAVSAVLADAGFETRTVGGWVRDRLLGAEPKDLDLCTTARPDAVAQAVAAAGMKCVPTGLGHGTVTVVVDGAGYEVTTLREDVATDGRHAEVSFVRDFRTDASRRDFTMNAMSATPDGVLWDYHGGEEDLAHGEIRFVGHARDRINEDYLRILRLFRFRARFGAEGRGEVALAAASALASGLSRISGERIWQEMRKLVLLPHATRELGLAGALGIAREIGIDYGAEGVARAEAARRSGASAPVVLGFLLGTPEAAQSACIRWKTSGREKELAVLAASHAGKGDAPAARFEELRDDLVARGRPETWAGEILSALGRTDEAQAMANGLPSFPLKGQDLIDAGLQAGPEIGTLLSAAKRLWLDSGRTAGKDDLLESVAGNRRRKPWA